MVHFPNGLKFARRLFLLLSIGCLTSLYASKIEASPELAIETGSLPPAHVIPIEISLADLEAPVEWDEVKSRVLADVAAIVGLLGQELEKLQNRSNLNLVEYLSKSETKWTVGNARGELTQVDGLGLIRVIHEPTKLSLIFLPPEASLDSDHLNQIIARQHIDAGDSDSKSRKTGRDVVIVTESEKGLVTTYYPKHPLGSPEWWGDYVRATFKAPKAGDYVLATYCAAMQTAIAACVSGTRLALGSSQEFEYAPMILSGLFASIIGTFASTYRVYTYRGSTASKFLKLSGVGLLYAYSLTLVRDGSATVFNITDPHNLLIHASILLNTTLNQKGRLAWQKLAELRDKLRYSAGQYDLTRLVTQVLPHLKPSEQLTISRASFFNQTLYLIPFSFKLIGLIGLGASFTIPLTNWSQDTGPWLLAGSIPAAIYVITQYSKRAVKALKSEIERIQSQISSGNWTEELEQTRYSHEHELRLVQEIHKELITEQKTLWKNILLRPDRLIKQITVSLVDSVEEVYHTWFPLLKTTLNQVGARCANFLLGYSKKTRN